MISTISPTSFDLVAISSLSAQINEAYDLADRYRALGVPVVLGGLHVTALPDEAGRHADAVVIGEGEPVWLEVLQDAEAGRLKRSYRARGDFPLADSPIPAFELLDPAKYNRLVVQTSRGCPLRCEFCASSILLTRRYKQKPIDKVLAEIDRIRSVWRRPFIEFGDDNAFVNRRYWKQLLPELRDAEDPLVRRNRPLRPRRCRAAPAHAHKRLRRGAHRLREPRRMGPARSRAQA